MDDTPLRPPTHCFGCGAVLVGSWTQHAPTCVLVRDGLVQANPPGVPPDIRAALQRGRTSRFQRIVDDWKEPE